MALLKKDDGLITAATLYQAGQGTIQLEFEAGADGSIKTTQVNLDKVTKGETMAIAAANPGEGFLGHRFVGNSFGISITNIGFNAFTIGDLQIGFAAGRSKLLVQGAIGKVAYITGTGISEERNIIEASTLVGRVIEPAVFQTLDGGILFGTSALDATASSVVFEEDSTIAVGDFDGGTGTAELVDGTFVKTVRLDEIDYPFTTVTGEILTPIGASLLFRG